LIHTVSVSASAAAAAAAAAGDDLTSRGVPRLVDNAEELRRDAGGVEEERVVERPRRRHLDVTTNDVTRSPRRHSEKTPATAGQTV